MTEKTITALILMSVLIMAIGSVAAFAVSTAYTDESPLTLAPGGTTNIKLVLQNVGGPDITVKAVVRSGSELIGLADSSDIYIVPKGEKVNVNLRASIPEDAKPGKLLEARVAFTTAEEGASGAFTLGSGIEQKIPILVAGKQAILDRIKEGALGNFGLIVAIIIIAILIVFFARKKKARRLHKK